MVRCAIWYNLYNLKYVKNTHGGVLILVKLQYHLYNLKNMKNTHRGVLILVKLQSSVCNFTKINSRPWMFFTFFKIVQMVPDRSMHHIRIFAKSCLTVFDRILNAPLKMFLRSQLFLASALFISSAD